MNTSKQIYLSKLNNGLYDETVDFIVVEKPLKIYVNYQHYTVIMCSPDEIKELTVGYLFSEGIISSVSDIISIEERFDDRVCVILKDEIKKSNNSSRAETSGCGKGSFQLDFFEHERDRLNENDFKISSGLISKCMKEFNNRSELFKQTGGVHSCAICGNEGILSFSEDIGRHNAMDKVIGKAMISNILLKDKFAMTTGRISSEIIIKVAKADIPIIVSHSAPTDLALDIAKSANLTVIGFARGNRMNIYCGEERIDLEN